jgi:hypothetical protein
MSDDDIVQAIKRMEAADRARRAATPSTPAFHNAAADVEDQARRIVQLTKEVELDAIRSEEPAQSPDPLDEV